MALDEAGLRDHALVVTLGAALGLDAVQIDAAWTQAAQL